MTVPALCNRIKGILTRAGADNPDGDCAEILMSVLGCSRTQLIARGADAVSDEIAEKAAAMAQRRASGEPIQYVIGSWSFMGRTYTVGKGVLIPRDDTEVVVREALRLLRPLPSPVVADLCAGSGIIAVTLAKELPGAAVFAVEKSEEAYGYLTRNIASNGAAVTPILGDLYECFSGFEDHSLDMIVSNPPYIRSREIDGLQKEVRYEPRLALDGGESGYDFYEAIIRLWTPKLKAGGYIAFEIGEGQDDHIQNLLKENSYTDIKRYLDIQGLTRAITAVYQP